MEIFDGHRALLRPLSKPCVALGNFDGVHLGHRQLLRQAVAAAAQHDGDSVVFTFEPHPARVLAPQYAPPLITTCARKLELIAEQGISVCVLEPFDQALAALEPEAFLQTIMLDVIGVRHIVVGYDFTFGRKRAGTISTLITFAAAHGFTVAVVDPVAAEGIVASSTKVREFIGEGNMAGARLLLGRDFEVEGTVIRGAGRGRTIGIPTANISRETELLPRPGVYAVHARILDDDRGELRKGVANLGTNPTFEGDSLSLEVHLFDVDEDMYGRRMRVMFRQPLRNERRFSGVDELVAQIHRDIEQARLLLS